MRMTNIKAEAKRVDLDFLKLVNNNAVLFNDDNDYEKKKTKRQKVKGGRCKM